MPLVTHTFHLNDERATLECGRRLAEVLRPGMVLHLSGDLGAGKTTLVRGLLAGLGHTGRVKSPTFTLLEPYNLSRLDFYHFDLYRFRDESEWIEAGFDELFTERAIAAIEWPEKAAGLVPPPDVRITLRVASAGAESGRDATFEGVTERGRQCIAELARTRSSPDA